MPPPPAPTGRIVKISRIKRTASLSAQATEQLEKFVVEQKLEPGSRLPTERELAEKFAVSRTVVREAVRSLVANGMLVVKAGSGTLIKRPSAANMTQTMSHYLRLGQGGLDHRKITEVRRLLEVEITGLAAERRTPEDLTRLREILERYERVRDSKAAYADWDVSFHLQIATATHNELLRLLLDSISGIMMEIRGIGFNVKGSHERAREFHTAIFKEIEAGNPAAARQAMRAHIEDSERIMAEGMASAARDG